MPPRGGVKPRPLMRDPEGTANGDGIPAVQRLSDIDWTRFTQRAAGIPPDVAAAAGSIIADVRADGDAALRRLTKKFDGCDLQNPFLSRAAWDRAADSVAADVRRAIDNNLRRIQAFHKLQAGRPQALETAPGVKLGRRPVPYDAVGCYVPGGRASYPSTVLMTVAPARIAGVKDVIVATPPRKDGSVDPVVLYAAKKAGATRVLRAGGAQAIAALAFGTSAIPAVQAIVGPGNAYVAAAKQQVAGRVWTDAPAGPSELLIIADKSAQAAEVALDLLAQAEHDPDAQVILVATDRGLAEAVRGELQARLPRSKRRDIIAASLEDHGAILVAKDLAEAMRFSNEYAPEHLTLMVKSPRAAFAQVKNAGSVFLGRNAPVSLGDYGSGTNHVLPTMGQARIRGGLSVEDFRKWITWQEVTSAGLRSIASDITTVAHAEGLHAHAEAVEKRLREQPASPSRRAKPKRTSRPPTVQR